MISPIQFSMRAALGIGLGVLFLTSARSLPSGLGFFTGLVAMLGIGGCLGAAIGRNCGIHKWWYAAGFGMLTSSVVIIWMIVSIVSSLRNYC